MFTKEDIAIALSDALMVHLVSKDSDLAKQQEAIREFGKGLVQEQVSGENAAKNIASNADQLYKKEKWALGKQKDFEVIWQDGEQTFFEQKPKN